jgi:uncharacterized protein YqjF (DUF2071 family)
VGDFPTRDVLDQVSHRPWPLPEGPWIMTQSWHHLLFAHWPVSVRELRERVPKSLAVDLFDGQAWIGVIPFHMSNVAPRGVPSIPLVSAFHELNVRTYVTRDGKPGIYFFSLDANSSLAVTTARTMFRLPYFLAEMTCEPDAGVVRYSSRRKASDARAELVATYRPTGEVRIPARGTLEHFLTERYCLYTVDDEFKEYRLEIHHPPWPLQPADAEITVNTMTDAAGVQLPAMSPLLHFAARQDVVAWPLSRI